MHKKRRVIAPKVTHRPCEKIIFTSQIHSLTANACSSGKILVCRKGEV